MYEHHKMVQLYLNLGYTKTGGICQGMTLRWLEACFLNQEDKFKKRIDRIMGYITDAENAEKTKKVKNQKEYMISLIDKAKEKKGHNLTKEDEELFDLLAFFDSLELYQSPQKHSSLFGIDYNRRQDEVESISDFAASDEILKLGGLALAYSEPLICLTPSEYGANSPEIENYLKELASAFNEVGTSSNEKRTFGVVFSSHDHTVGLTYQPGDPGEWSYFDINRYNSKTKVSDIKNLAKMIASGFFPKNESQVECIAFNSYVFTTKNSLTSELEESLNTLKKSHIIDEKMAGREIDGDNINLVFIAAMGGHASVITELARNGANLDIVTNKGVTPALVAAERGYVEVIKALVENSENKADLGKGINGVTPAHVAAANGHVEVIRVLAEINVDLLDQADKNGMTPAHSAAINGYANVIKELARHDKLDLGKGNKDRMTPAHIAAINGHVEFIERLAEINVDLVVKTDKYGKTPCHYAAETGNLDVIVQLIKYGVNLDASYKTSVTALREKAILKGKEVASRMDDFINKHLESGKETISITPNDVAVIMGHEVMTQSLKKEKIEEEQKLSPAVFSAVNKLETATALKDLIKKDLPYAYKDKGRYHLFKAKSSKEEYKGVTGDMLKRDILVNFKKSIIGVTDSSDLKKIVDEFKKSEEYTILKTGQGLMTRAFGLKTSSVEAFEKIVEMAETSIKGLQP